jgi:LCP family protein required for cell wall assembly
MRHGSRRTLGYGRARVRRGWYARHFTHWHQLGILGKIGYCAATVAAVAGVTAGVGGYAWYRNLVGNIKVVNVGGLTGKTVYGTLNILVLGSQERAGQTGYFGVAAGDSPYTDNSDNLLLIHLDATHTHATILSIPRDTFVYEPGCQARNHMIGIGIQGPYAYPPGNIIDGALNIGGPTCAVETVEDLTGIKLDHFIEFDFNSFRTMVDALGGVEVCVPPGRGYHDKASGVNLSPGKHHLTYDQALAYVRQRDDLGGPDAGGDLPRIAVQQAFISSVVQQVNADGLLSNIPELLSIAGTATKALTVDSGLGTVTELLDLAKSLVHLKTKDVSMITMPTTADTFDYPTYDEHLMTVEPQDDVLFWMMMHSLDWHGHLPLQRPGTVEVRVLNATGQPGLAGRTAAALRKLHFDVIGIGNAPYTSTTTVTYAGIDRSDSAYTVMRALKTFPAGQNLISEPQDQLGSPGPVNLILGADFAGVNPPPPSQPATNHKAKAGKNTKSGSSSGANLASQSASQNGPGAVESRNAAANICSGLPTSIG